MFCVVSCLGFGGQYWPHKITEARLARIRILLVRRAVLPVMWVHSREMLAMLTANVVSSVAMPTPLETQNLVVVWTCEA